MIGESAGLNLRNEGGAGMPAGSSGITAAIAVCTSTAALSMSRSRSNCSVTLRAARRARRGHLVDAGDGRELPLERAGDGGGHRAGIAARQPGADIQRREIDIRQIADRQRAISDDAQAGDAEHQQARRNRTTDEQLGNVHPPMGPRRRARARSLSVGSSEFHVYGALQRPGDHSRHSSHQSPTFPVTDAMSFAGS